MHGPVLPPPQPDGLVLAPTRKKHSVSGPGNCMDLPRVSSQHQSILPRLHLPHPHCPVLSGTCQLARGCGVEADCANPVRVIAVGEELAQGREAPDADGLVVAGGGDHLLVLGMKLQTRHSSFMPLERRLQLPCPRVAHEDRLLAPPQLPPSHRDVGGAGGEGSGVEDAGEGARGSELAPGPDVPQAQALVPPDARQRVPAGAEAHGRDLCEVAAEDRADLSCLGAADNDRAVGAGGGDLLARGRDGDRGHRVLVLLDGKHAGVRDMWLVEPLNEHGAQATAEQVAVSEATEDGRPVRLLEGKLEGGVGTRGSAP
eukprot:756141-Hanusia_phi.AAC.10